MKTPILFFLALAAAPLAAAGGQTPPTDSEGCFDLSDPETPLNFTGTLGPNTTTPGEAEPEGLSKPQAQLNLSASICLTKGMETDPSRLFDSVDIRAPDDLIPVLNAASGRPVTVTGLYVPRPGVYVPLLYVTEIHIVAEEYQIAG